MTRSIGDSHDEIIKEAVQCFVDARLRGEELAIDELAGQYPGMEREIAESIEDLAKIDTLFDSLVRVDEDDLEEAATGDSLIGRTVGGFEMVEMLGRGAMGIVYLAHDTRLDRSVAIKTMPAEIAGDSTARKRFRREARLLASLNHPNIAVIHEIVEEEKSGYLVLEHVPGETLAERIARAPLKLEEALGVARQVAEAISAAHKKGIIHRDLKPSNIKITPEGRVKVLDFGLAKFSVPGGMEGETTTTEPGHVIGTPAYMSPEQARGKETDHRTDIWSFGCILYQMLTGQRPFEGETATDILVQIIEREPDWSRLPEETPAAVRRLLRRCLTKDPDRRLADIAEVLKELPGIPAVSPPTTPARLRRVAIAVAVIGLVGLSAVALWFAAIRHARPAASQIRLAVLPFENLEPVDDDYFANGITDAITTRLTNVSQLRVTARRSAMQYKNKDTGLQQVGEELGVDYVVEGTVQRERPADPNSRVKVSMQLSRVSENTNVCGQSYETDLDELFQMQSDIAEKVVEALNIALLEPERQALVSAPTRDMLAHDYYLRGNDYFYRGYDEQDFKTAIGRYNEAIHRDPNFTLAHAQLSRAHSYLYWFHDRTESRLGMARKAIEKALALEPDLPEVRLALGHYYYHGHRWDKLALQVFEEVRKSQPDNSDLLQHISAIHRRHGQFEEALANAKKAFDIDPRYGFLAEMIGTTLVSLREYSQAEEYYERAISLAPDLPNAYWFKARLYLNWQGGTLKARNVLNRAVQNAEGAKEPFIVVSLLILDVYDGNYPDALARLDSWPMDSFDTTFYFIPTALLKARIYGLTGDQQREQIHYESARSILEARKRDGPEDARVYCSLGIAYAGLGRKDDAIREGERGIELLAVHKARPDGNQPLWDLARIYVMVGAYEKAIDQLEEILLVENPSRLSFPLLQLDPVWAPLSSYPRFQKLIQAGG